MKIYEVRRTLACDCRQLLRGCRGVERRQLGRDGWVATWLPLLTSPRESLQSRAGASLTGISESMRHVDMRLRFDLVESFQDRHLEVKWSKKKGSVQCRVRKDAQPVLVS
jgi:hypothetical protein